jgi:hypothetical protein
MQTLFTKYKQKTDRLNRLTAEIEQRNALLARLHACLTPNTQKALVSASILDDTLILLAQSAAWASRLRLEGQALLIAANDPNLRQYRIQVMTQTNDIIESKIQHSAEKPCEEALIALQALTDKLAPNDTLKASMIRLLRVLNPQER